MTARGLLRAVAVTLVALTMSLPATASHAHSSVTGSSPRAGAVLDRPPAQVTVRFDGPLMDVGAAIVVRAADGTIVSTGEHAIDRNTISAPVRTDGPAGRYTVAFRVVSQDGHTVSSTFDYRVTTGPSGSAAGSEPSEPAAGLVADDPPSSEAPEPAVSASADAPPAGGGPAWLLIGGLALIALAVGAVLVLRAARIR